jgi:hypothetical protein
VQKVQHRRTPQPPSPSASPSLSLDSSPPPFAAVDMDSSMGEISLSDSESSDSDGEAEAGGGGGAADEVQRVSRAAQALQPVDVSPRSSTGPRTAARTAAEEPEAKQSLAPPLDSGAAPPADGAAAAGQEVDEDNDDASCAVFGQYTPEWVRRSKHVRLTAAPRHPDVLVETTSLASTICTEPVVCCASSPPPRADSCRNPFEPC